MPRSRSGALERAADGRSGPGRTARVVGAAAAGLGLGVAVGGCDSTGAAGPTVGTTSPAPQASPTVSATYDRRSPAAPTVRTQVERILARRTTALRDRDLPAWIADLDPRDRAAGRRQRSEYAALTRLPGARVNYRLLGAVHPASDEAQWRARVLLDEQVRGIDTTPARLVRTMRFGVASGRVVLLGTEPVSAGAQPWELGLGEVQRDRRSVVVGPLRAGGSSAPETRRRLRRLAAAADVATDVVTAVWGRDWSRRAVVVLPRSQSEMARLLRGGDPRRLDAIAAATTTLPSEGGAPPQTRVVVNPRTTRRLGGVGLSALLRHEITHVATATRSGRVPLWLSEGLADYLGYRDVPAPPAALARDLLRRVAVRGAPAALPGAGEFAATSGSIAEAYEGAWLAVRVLVDRCGEPRVVRFYRAVRKIGVEAALARVLAWSGAGLRQAWRARLVALAR